MEKRKFTAIYKKEGRSYIGWIEEVPGVNTQGYTKSEVKENLKEALSLTLDANRVFIEQELGQDVQREPLTIIA